MGLLFGRRDSSSSAGGSVSHSFITWFGHTLDTYYRLLVSMSYGAVSLTHWPWVFCLCGTGTWGDGGGFTTGLAKYLSCSVSQEAEVASGACSVYGVEILM